MSAGHGKLRVGILELVVGPALQQTSWMYLEGQGVCLCL